MSSLVGAIRTTNNMKMQLKMKEQEAWENGYNSLDGLGRKMITIKHKFSQSLVTPTFPLERMRQENHKFESSLDNFVS